jgi:hypothetical protein
VRGDVEDDQAHGGELRRVGSELAHGGGVAVGGELVLEHAVVVIVAGCAGVLVYRGAARVAAVLRRRVRGSERPDVWTSVASGGAHGGELGQVGGELVLEHAVVVIGAVRAGALAYRGAAGSQ